MGQSSNIRTIIALVLITLAGFGMRLCSISQNSLSLDEGYTLFLAKKSTPEMLHSIMADDNHPPLHYLLMKLWVPIAGQSEFALRLPSAVAGTLAVPAAYALAAAAFGSGTGIAVACILAVSRYNLALSQEGRGYSLMVLLGILSYYFFFLIQSRPARKNIVLYVVSTILLFYTHYYGAFVILGQVLYFAYKLAALPRENKTGYLKSNMIIFGVVFLFCAPWLPVMFFRARAEAPLTRFGSLLTKEIFVAFGTYAGSILALLVFMFILIAWMIQQRRNLFSKATWETENGAWALFICWVTAVIIIPYIFSFFTVPFFTRRCAVTASIPFYILIAFTVYRINLRFLRIILLAALFFTCIFEDLRYFSAPINPRWKECSRMIDEVKKDGDALVFSPAGCRDYVFSYYSKKRPSHCFLYPIHDAPVSGETKSMIDTLKKYPTIYFARGSEILDNGAFESALARGFAMKDSVEFGKLVMYKVENRVAK
ncbi:MAG TPA: glycosyltransferase family 39 protein [Chitinivibrionales bacterium]|nr:glycosyltransferase family 39 protein [Chitinivibrionales bacterium]